MKPLSQSARDKKRVRQTAILTGDTRTTALIWRRTVSVQRAFQNILAPLAACRAMTNAVPISRSAMRLSAASPIRSATCKSRSAAAQRPVMLGAKAVMRDKPDQSPRLSIEIVQGFRGVEGFGQQIQRLPRATRCVDHGSCHIDPRPKRVAGCEVDAESRVAAGGKAPIERRANVVDFSESGSRDRPRKRRHWMPDIDRGKRSRKYVACRRAAAVAFAMPSQLLQRVGADRLQQIPTRSDVPVQHDQGLRDEVGDVLHDGGEVGDAITHHCGGRLDGEAAGEYGQVAQQTLLGFRQ